MRTQTRSSSHRAWLAQARRMSRHALAWLIGMHAMADAAAIPSKAASASKASTATATSAPTARPSPNPTMVYRCVQADGRVLYAQQACTGGHDASATTSSTRLKTGDARTATQIKQGQDVHLREKKLGQRMQRERRKAEQSSAGSQAIALGPTSNKARDKARNNKIGKADKARKPDPRAPKPLIRPDFIARVPASVKQVEAARR